jgi:RNA polymerase sigma-70 factor (ECF subfamily)
LAGDDQGSVSSMASQREFTDFYTEWRDSIRRALALTIGDITIADDATEEAMTRALASWAKIRDYDRPEGWVYRVGLNWSRGLFRKRRYEILTQLDPDSAPAETPVPDVDVIDAVGRLSRQLRPIVIARYYLDWSTADVAAAFDIPEGTVKSRLSRALTRLAQDLGDTP